MVHWLGPGLSLLWAWVQSLVGGLRSLQLHGAAQTKQPQMVKASQAPFLSVSWVQEFEIQSSLVVQWLKIHAFIAGDRGSIPRRGTKILQAMWCSRNKDSKGKGLGSPGPKSGQEVWGWGGGGGSLAPWGYSLEKRVRGSAAR